MRAVDTLAKLVPLLQTLASWGGALGDLKGRRRERIARYADEIAHCLARLAAAAGGLADGPGGGGRDQAAFVRELGRLAGYVEDVADTLKGHLDGRKIAGVKRRLQGLAAGPWPGDAPLAATLPLEALLEAEGYMRALADRLRV